MAAPWRSAEPQYMRVSSSSAERAAEPRRPCWMEYLNVESDQFSSIMGFFIIINAAVMGLETDFGEERFIACEHFFCQLFLVEMGMNIRQRGIEHLADPSSLFDCVLVCVGALDLYVLPRFAVAAKPSSSATDAHQQGAGNIASLLRILRLMRVLRVLRLFKMFRSLAMIMTAFMKAFHIVLWVGLLTVIIDYVCAIFLTRTVGHQAHLWKEDAKDVEDWFGTIPKSMRTLFIIMTLAEWDTIALTLCEQMPTLLVFSFFIFYILVASYTMVSLITGVLSESLAQAQSEDERNKTAELKEERHALLKNLQRTFLQLDQDGDNVITEVELKKALRTDPDLLAKLAALSIQVTEKTLVELMVLLGDGRGVVQADTFVGAMSSITGIASASMAYHIQHRARSALHLVSTLGRRIEELHAKQDALARQVEDLAGLLRKALGIPGPYTLAVAAKDCRGRTNEAATAWRHLGNTKPP